MQLGPVFKFAERALPFVATFGSLAIQLYQARAAAKTGSAPGPDLDTSNAGGAFDPADLQVSTKLHGPTGGQIGYGKDGRYLGDSLSNSPTSH